MVPVQPVVSKEAIAAFTSTVAVPPPELPSNVTGSDAVGAGHPLVPPEASDHFPVSLQLPVPVTQNRATPHNLLICIASLVPHPPATLNAAIVPTGISVSICEPSRSNSYVSPAVTSSRVKSHVSPATVVVCVHRTSGPPPDCQAVHSVTSTVPVPAVRVM